MSYSSYRTHIDFDALHEKASAKITRFNPLKTLKNSTGSVQRFLSYIETDPSFSNRS